MGLPFEYFKNQKHINDLKKLNDQELYFIIRLFKDELAYFNNFDGFKLKGLIIACDKMKDLIKDLRFIFMNSYMIIIKDNGLTFCSIEDIERISSEIDEVEKYLIKIKSIRISKEKVNELTDICLLKMRILYDSINDFMYMEKHLWNAYNSREEKINIRERYIEQDKFNTDE